MFKKLNGVTLSHRKKTRKMPAVLMPSPSTVTIPMNMNIGNPANPCVKVGDDVTDASIRSRIDRLTKISV